MNWAPSTTRPAISRLTTNWILLLHATGWNNGAWRQTNFFLSNTTIRRHALCRAAPTLGRHCTPPSAFANDPAPPQLSPDRRNPPRSRQTVVQTQARQHYIIEFDKSAQPAISFSKQRANGAATDRSALKTLGTYVPKICRHHGRRGIHGVTRRGSHVLFQAVRPIQPGEQDTPLLPAYRIPEQVSAGVKQRA